MGSERRPWNITAIRSVISISSSRSWLVTSQDLDELIEITDRIAVMFHGRLSQPLATAEATREKLGLLMGGSALAEKEAADATGT